MKKENAIWSGIITAGLVFTAIVVQAQNPNVPLAQNALGTIGVYPNSSSGTAINKIVTLTGAPSKVVTITAGATSGAIGIVAGGAGFLLARRRPANAASDDRE